MNDRELIQQALDALLHAVPRDSDQAYEQVAAIVALRARLAQPEPIAYTQGEWFDATTVDLMQRFYESRLPSIREAAREHGYAIGVHGSMRRDLDLIAAPWRDDASQAGTLAHAIAKAACGIDRDGPYDWEKKPAGRISTCIPICWTHRHGVPSDGHIDLSVMPVAPEVPEGCTPSDAAMLRKANHTLAEENDRLRKTEQPEQPSEMNRIAAQKLDELITEGYVVCGVMIQRQNEDGTMKQC